MIKEPRNEIKKNNRKNRNTQIVCAWIPNRVDNHVIVSVLELMRKAQRLFHKDFSVNLKYNEKNFKRHIEIIQKNHGYVEDQNNYADMKYGKVTMKYAGCEIFATYNAVFSLTEKHEMSLARMIFDYEKDGVILSGKFGTSPKAISDYLTRLGFITYFSTDEEEFDKIGREYDSLILTMYNDRNDIRKEVHTINISKDFEMYTAHNVYCNGNVVGPYACVSEVIKNINGGKAKGISLIGIKKGDIKMEVHQK